LTAGENAGQAQLKSQESVQYMKRYSSNSNHFIFQISNLYSRHITDYSGRGGVVSLHFTLNWRVGLVLVVKCHFVTQRGVVVAELIRAESWVLGREGSHYL
jgi:hypothetical protein